MARQLPRESARPEGTRPGGSLLFVVPRNAKACFYGKLVNESLKNYAEILRMILGRIEHAELFILDLVPINGHTGQVEGQLHSVVLPPQEKQGFVKGVCIDDLGYDVYVRGCDVGNNEVRN